MTKLTLSVDEAVVVQAKELAAANKTSVSAMFSHYVLSRAGRSPRTMPIAPLTRKALGIAKLPPGKDWREVRDEALLEKYGIRK